MLKYFPKTAVPVSHEGLTTDRRSGQESKNNLNIGVFYMYDIAMTISYYECNN